MTENQLDPKELFDGAVEEPDGPTETDHGPTEGATGAGAEPSAEPTQADREPQQSVTSEAVPRKVFKIRGREYTKDELISLLSDESRLEDFVQTYEQFPHLQRKHVELLTSMRAAPREPAPQQGQAQEPRPVGPKDIVKSYAPQVQVLKEAGFFSEDFVELYGDEAALLVAALDDLYSRINQALESVADVQPLLRAVRDYGTIAEARDIVTRVDELAKSLATEGEYFSDLNDSNKRWEFLNWIGATLNPSNDLLLGDGGKRFLRDQWLAYNSEAILKAASARHGTGQRPPVSGEVSGARSAPRSQGVPDDIRELFSAGM